jgi:hypothetical protein
VGFSGQGSAHTGRTIRPKCRGFSHTLAGRNRGRPTADHRDTFIRKIRLFSPVSYAWTEKTGTLEPVSTRDSSKKKAEKAAKQYESGLSAEASALVESYNPLKSKFGLCTKDEWGQVAPTVRSAVSNLVGLNDRGIRPYLTAMTRISVWALREGLPLEVGILLAPRTIEAHIKSIEGSKATFRSQLRRLAEVNGAVSAPTAVQYARASYQPPYTSDDVHALLRFARSMSNLNRRRQLVGFILLGAGCGFSRSDLRGVSRTSVHRHDERLYVRTANRCTPVLEEFCAEFEDYLTWCADGPFIHTKPGANITDRMSAWVGNRQGVPRLSTDRLRAFFVVEHLRRGTPLLDLLSYCGFVRVDALEPYLQFVEIPKTPCSPDESGVS